MTPLHLLSAHVSTACAGSVPGDFLVPGAIVALALALVAARMARRTKRQDPLRPPVGIADDYRLIAQASGEVFFEFDPGTRAITWTSDLGAGFLGYSPGELTFHESTLLNMIHRADQEPMRQAWVRLQTMERLDMEVRLIKKNGQWCWVHIIAVPENGPDGKLERVVGVFRNTQELHDTQEALAEARRIETVGTMAGGIAHEFNNHLTPVHGYIEMALDELDSHHPACEGLKVALERVEYCSELVSQIQAYGRKSFLLPKPIEITRVLPSMVRVALSAVNEKGGMICLEEQWPPYVPTIWVDQGQLQQAIIHLVRNSCQAMPGGGHLTVRAEESTFDAVRCKDHPGSRPGEFLCISIADTGRGISADNLERVLDPFYTTREPGGGRGMGLKMVHGMVAQHGGWIEIRSTLGKGTEVQLYIPVGKPRREDRAAMPTDADGTMAVLPAAPVGTLLVADDEDFIRDLVARIFESEGWRVEKVVDHAQVWDALRAGRQYDLIILDLTMPGPSAEDTVSEIARAQPHTKVLIISGFARDGRVDKLIRLCDADFLAKPFSPKDIISRVDRLMAMTASSRA